MSNSFASVVIANRAYFYIYNLFNNILIAKKVFFS